MWQKGAKMKWKNRLTNYNFWISIVSATLLILQAFNIKLDIANINEIVTALLGLLVVIGIINDPTKSGKDAENAKEKSTSNTLKTKHNGCEKAKTDACPEDKITQIDGAEVGVAASLTEKENDTNMVENSSDEKSVCPACEEIEQTKNEQEDLPQSDENQIDNEQHLADLNSQAFDAVMENQIPSAKQNEADYDLAENDLQILISQISMDIKNKYVELNKLVENLNIAANKGENTNIENVCEKTDNLSENADDTPSNLNPQTENTLQNQTNENLISQSFGDELNGDFQSVEIGQCNTEFVAENVQDDSQKQPEMPTHFNIVN